MDDGTERSFKSINGKTHAEIDEWQTEMQLKPLRVGTVHLFTEGLSDEERALTGVNMVDSVAGAVRKSVAAAGDPRVAVVPEGPYVVPVHRSAA